MEKHSNTMIDPKNHSSYITILYSSNFESKLGLEQVQRELLGTHTCQMGNRNLFSLMESLSKAMWWYPALRSNVMR